MVFGVNFCPVCLINNLNEFQIAGSSLSNPPLYKMSVFLIEQLVETTTLRLPDKFDAFVASFVGASPIDGRRLGARGRTKYLRRRFGRCADA